jgi:hypothetical protein
MSLSLNLAESYMPQGLSRGGSSENPYPGCEGAMRWKLGSVLVRRILIVSINSRKEPCSSWLQRRDSGV